MNRQLQEFKADFFKVLAHPMRIRILELLAGGEKSVNQLQAALGVEAAAVSQQLAVLRSKSIVDAKKDGTKVIYSLVLGYKCGHKNVESVKLKARKDVSNIEQAVYRRIQSDGR